MFCCDIIAVFELIRWISRTISLYDGGESKCTWIGAWENCCWLFWWKFSTSKIEFTLGWCKVLETASLFRLRKSFEWILIKKTDYDTTSICYFLNEITKKRSKPRIVIKEIINEIYTLIEVIFCNHFIATNKTEYFLSNNWFQIDVINFYRCNFLWNNLRSKFQGKNALQINGEQNIVITYFIGQCMNGYMFERLNCQNTVGYDTDKWS